MVRVVVMSESDGGCCAAGLYPPGPDAGSPKVTVALSKTKPGGA
jgi:hypothetical protein